MLYNSMLFLGINKCLMDAEAAFQAYDILAFEHICHLLEKHIWFMINAITLKLRSAMPQASEHQVTFGVLQPYSQMKVMLRPIIMMKQ